MIEKKIGKINRVSFGWGGYQDVMIGISFTLSSDKDGWGTSDFRGTWGTEWTKTCKWTEQDRINLLGKMVMNLAGLLSKAKVQNITELKGTPVEVTFIDSKLKSWRILEEII